MSLSSGGGFITLSNSTRGLLYSCELGLYVPRVALLFLAIMKNITKLTIRANINIKAIGPTIKAISATLAGEYNGT